MKVGYKGVYITRPCYRDAFCSVGPYESCLEKLANIHPVLLRYLVSLS